MSSSTSSSTRPRSNTLPHRPRASSASLIVSHPRPCAPLRQSTGYSPPSQLRQSLNGHLSLSHRIPRKPPPIIDEDAIRFPQPDPEDPFAPLWELRNPGTSNSTTSSRGEERRQSEDLQLLDLANSVASTFENEAWGSWMSPAAGQQSSELHTSTSLTSATNEFGLIHHSVRIDSPAHRSLRDQKPKRPHTSDGCASGAEKRSFKLPSLLSLSSSTSTNCSSPPSTLSKQKMQRSPLSSTTTSPSKSERHTRSYSASKFSQLLPSRDSTSSARSPSPTFSLPPLEFDSTEINSSQSSATSTSFPPSPDPLADLSASITSVLSSKSSTSSFAESHFTALTTPFEEHSLPTADQLVAAESLDLLTENGIKIRFGDTWKGQKTVVIFIRHFWCPMCQDYMFSISRNVSPAVLAQARTKLVIISNGSHEMIKAYRRIFRTPFEVYTDPTLKIYRAMGMSLKTLEKGDECGAYIRHGTVSGTFMVILNAMKVGIPFWVKGGDISQLGGEFVLGPGLQCSYAHRMTTTRNHVSILSVLKKAGIDMVTPLRKNMTLTGRSFIQMTPEEEAEWREKRKAQLFEIKEKKRLRRGGRQWCGSMDSFSSRSSAFEETAPLSDAASLSTIRGSCAAAARFLAEASADAHAEIEVVSRNASSRGVDEVSYSGGSDFYSCHSRESSDSEPSLCTLEEAVIVESMMRYTAVKQKALYIVPPGGARESGKKAHPPAPVAPIHLKKGPREDTFFAGAGLFMSW